MRKNPPKKNILRFGKYILLIIGVTIFTAVMYQKILLFKNKRNPEYSGGGMGNPQKIVSSESISKNISEDNWKEYRDLDFGFSLKTPPLLIKNKTESPKDYLLFIRFEENEFSKDKGVAIGITRRTIDNETAKIIEDFNKESVGANPVVKDIIIVKFNGKSINVIGADGLEPRSVIVFNNNKYTFSISTTPEQIEAVANSLYFY